LNLPANRVRKEFLVLVDRRWLVSIANPLRG
jgi:hypothetical protein